VNLTGGTEGDGARCSREAVQGRAAWVRRCRRSGRRLGEDAPTAAASSSSCSPPAPPPLLWCGGGGQEKGHGWLGFVAAAAGLGGGLGYLRGRLEDRGAGPDAEGGDARRPCCGHTAGIRRLRRGARVCGAGGRGAGEKGNVRAGGYAGLSRSGAARGAGG
jgi:hypothetical protein